MGRRFVDDVERLFTEDLNDALRVSRADPLAGGADRVVGALVAQAIDLPVVRQRQVRARGDHEIRVLRQEPLRAERTHLVDQHRRIDDHRLAEHAGDAGPEHT